MFFEKLYPKILAFPDFQQQLQLGFEGKVFQQLWFQNLYDKTSCLQNGYFDDFNKICQITYDENGDTAVQICSKCRTRKISLKACPPETKSAKLHKKNYASFYRFWPEILSLISKRIKNFPSALFEASQAIQSLGEKERQIKENKNVQRVQVCSLKFKTEQLMFNLDNLFKNIHHSSEIRPYLRTPRNPQALPTFSYSKDKIEESDIKVTKMDRNFRIST